MSEKVKDKENNTEVKGNIDESDQSPLVRNRFLRGVLIGLGTLSLGLGIIGIFLPILPTTPFLLLAAWCYARSSKKYYDWLISNKRFGKYIKDYREGRGIPVRAKVSAVVVLWITILISVFFVVSMLLMQILMLGTAVVVTIYIISIKPKR
jgi:uncharacterized membrane protein YbaN (DUF454 family)